MPHQKNWRPKPFRPADPPAPKEQDRLLEYISTRVDQESYYVFSGLARQAPFERLMEALKETTALFAKNPMASSVVNELLPRRLYDAYCAARMADLDRANSLTAHRLLCLDDRQNLVSFMRRTPDLLKENHDTPKHSCS